MDAASRGDAPRGSGRGQLLLVGHVFDIMPRYGTPRTMIEDGVIGPVRQIITEQCPHVCRGTTTE